MESNPEEGRSLKIHKGQLCTARKMPLADVTLRARTCSKTHRRFSEEEQALGYSMLVHHLNPNRRRAMVHSLRLPADVCKMRDHGRGG